MLKLHTLIKDINAAGAQGVLWIKL